MTIAKKLHRLRRRLSSALAPQHPLPTRHSHRAYPEIQVNDDGSWIVRMLSYQPIGWLYQGETYDELPADVPEPTLRHPTTYAVGLAPPENVQAWNDYYAARPQPLTLIEQIVGQASDRQAALKAAHKAMRQKLDDYRRDQP